MPQEKITMSGNSLSVKIRHGEQYYNQEIRNQLMQKVPEYSEILDLYYILDFQCGNCSVTVSKIDFDNAVIYLSIFESRFIE